MTNLDIYMDKLKSLIEENPKDLAEFLVSKGVGVGCQYCIHYRAMKCRLPTAVTLGSSKNAVCKAGVKAWLNKGDISNDGT